MTASEDGITIHAAEKQWAMGELGSCLIVLWRGVATEPAVLQVNEAIWNLTQRRPGKCAYITVIEPSSPPPATPVRKLVMSGIARPGSSLTCLAAVMEGNEFRLTIVRAILAGMALLRPNKQPSKVFKQAQEMSLWIAKQLQSEDNLQTELVRAVEVIRSKMPT